MLDSRCLNPKPELSPKADLNTTAVLNIHFSSLVCWFSHFLQQQTECLFAKHVV